MLSFVVVFPVVLPPMSGWSALDGLYWSIITFSTAGLGDMVIEAQDEGGPPFPYGVPGASTTQADPVAKWAPLIDPFMHIYFIFGFVNVGAILSALGDFVTYDIGAKAGVLKRPAAEAPEDELEDTDAGIWT